MEFNDKPLNDMQDGQFEIILQDSHERDLVVAAMSGLAVESMTGRRALINRLAAQEILRYLSLDAALQREQTVTYIQALGFARLIQRGAQSLTEPQRTQAESIASAIEIEALARNIIDQSGDPQPNDF